MQRILIIGAGGHAQVVADILQRAREAGVAVHPLGYLDDNPDRHHHTLLGLRVFGPIAAHTTINYDTLIIGIGDNALRRRLFSQLAAQGARFAIARHPSAIIAPDARIGAGTVLAAGSIVNPGSSIGVNSIINTGSSIDHHNHIGAHVHIAPGVHLGGDVTIGDGALIGIGAIIMPQRSVGEHTVVGAGAVVHEHLPSSVVVAGVPARILRQSEL